MATRTPAPSVNTTTAVPPYELNTYYKNARRGDVPTIVGSLKAHGQYKPIVVNLGNATGRPNEVLAGNHTLMAFRTLAEQHPDDERWSNILVHWVDVDEDRAARIVLVDNRSAEIGSVDNDQLYDLICSLGDNLEGTGYDEDYLAMLADLASGPPSLDDLADEAGDPLPDDAHPRIRLILEPEVVRLWEAHRLKFNDDSAALKALLVP